MDPQSSSTKNYASRKSSQRLSASKLFWLKNFPLLHNYCSFFLRENATCEKNCAKILTQFLASSSSPPSSWDKKSDIVKLFILTGFILSQGTFNKLCQKILQVFCCWAFHRGKTLLATLKTLALF